MVLRFYFQNAIILESLFFVSVQHFSVIEVVQKYATVWGIILSSTSITRRTEA
jgi:hypothetical protein